MIQVEDLSKTYRIGFWRKSVEALRGVSFEVKDGDLYGFIGPNGAGKSTTIKILLGLLKPGSGRASLMGMPAGSPRSRKDVGFLPEQPYFYDYLTGREFLWFYGQLDRPHMDRSQDPGQGGFRPGMPQARRHGPEVAHL